MSQYQKFAESHLEVMGETGNELIVLCPFHDDTQPSMYVNKTSGLWICHACGLRGNGELLSQKLLGVPMEQSSKVDMDDVRETLHRLEERTQEEKPLVHYKDSWLKLFAFDTGFWRERGFSDEIVERFYLGFDPFHNEATIPYRDEFGNIIGYIGRKLERGASPKYVNPKDVDCSHYLFGAWLLKDEEEVVLVEGALDAIALWDVGVPALAFLGSSLKERQAVLLRKLGIRSVVIWADNDKDGLRGVRRTTSLLDGFTVNVVDVVHKLGKGHFPDFKDAGDCPKEFRAEIASLTVPIWEWKRLGY